jgi:drug/metabolite transporter (DMT)-like permease
MPNETLTIPKKARLIDNAPVFVSLLIVVDSLHFVFARLLLPYLHPLASAFFVLAVATVQVAVFAGLRGQIRFETFRRNLWFFLAIGLLVGISTGLNYSSVAFIDPGTATLLGKTTVIFGLGFGIFWLKDKLNRIQAVGALLAVLGVAIVTFQPGDFLRIGALMVITSSFMYALHAALVKRHSGHLNLTEFFLFRLLATTGILLILAAGGGHLTWPDGRVWLMLLVVGTVDVVISRGLYYISLRRLNISQHSIVLTLSPVVAIVWSLILFGTSPTSQQLIGGLVVLSGVLLVTVAAGRSSTRLREKPVEAVESKPG